MLNKDGFSKTDGGSSGGNIVTRNKKPLIWIILGVAAAIGIIVALNQ